jgi:5-methylcytosine-specific restriction protein A
MPRAPSTCNVNGCTRPAPPGQGRCEPHRLAQRKTHDQRRPNANQRGYDKRWRTTRAGYLAANPRCVVCDQPATDVDHIDGMGPSSPRGHDWSNLQAMCHACHTRKTNILDGGGWPRA